MTDVSELETRSPEERAADLAEALPRQVARARALAGGAGLAGIDPAEIRTPADLSRLPVLRKSDLIAAQAERPPFGGLASADAAFTHLFQSPGPIYEPGRAEEDWFRLGRFLRACGIGAGDVVQNCFGYHLTPAGMMFDTAARSVGAAVIPAGTGQTELQARAAAHLGATAYAGTPDYLKVVIEKADELDLTLGIVRAAVSGGALFPSLRAWYADRGIACRQCYATADLGNIAYESEAMDGLIVDEGVVVEIVTPGTGDPVPEGEVGEVVVTALSPDYPLIRFTTGDLSAVLPGPSPCGRTNTRIRGWMGRADQTAKIKGMFVRPEQVAELVRRLNAGRARVTVTRQGEADMMHVAVEAESPGDAEALDAVVREVLKLRASVEAVAPGSLPRDGKVIDDQRRYET